MALATATATFTGAEDTVAVVWSTALVTSPVVTYGITVTDGQTLDADVTSITTTGCTVEPTARFVGTVELIASE